MIVKTEGTETGTVGVWTTVTRGENLPGLKENLPELEEAVVTVSTNFSSMEKASIAKSCKEKYVNT